MALVYQHFSYHGFQVVPLPLPHEPVAHLHPAGCLQCCATCSVAAGAGATCQPWDSPAFASPVIDSCSCARVEAADL